MSDLLAVVGDVHGDATRLELMLSALRGRRGRVIFVGDYVDRGPQSAQVLELLASTVDAPDARVTLLAGNHESELVHYLETGDFVRYAAIGGMATIRAYVKKARGDVHRQFRKAFPERHERLIRSMATHYESDSLLVSHAGFDPANPNVRSREAMVDGRFPDLLARDDHVLPRPIVVCGHYIQNSGRPFDRGGLVCVDTGCGSIGGPLTAFLMPEREYVAV
jgi:serine/threonine protein phosphatase 1